MRPFKFRGWDQDRHVMWHGFEILPTQMIYPQKLQEQHRQAKLTFMQYTGITDKLGTEVFDGDIVRVTDLEDPWVGEVVFYEAGYFVESFYLAPDGVTRRTDMRWFLKGHLVEVVGNIYENPELLEVKQ